MSLTDIKSFHSEKCKELFDYAVVFTNAWNQIIDDGGIVFKDDVAFNGRFVTEYDGKPVIGVLSDGCVISWFGDSYDDNNKIWMDGFETFEDIKKEFDKLSYVRKSNIEKIDIQMYFNYSNTLVTND